MPVTHHGGPICDRRQAANEHRLRGLGRPIDERGAAGTVLSMAGWLSFDVTVGRINQELAERVAALANASRPIRRDRRGSHAPAVRAPKVRKAPRPPLTVPLRAAGLTRPVPNDA